MKAISPVYPIPHWFTNVLSEHKDATIIMWAFIQQSLDRKLDELPASYKDIRDWTGLLDTRVADNIKLLRDKGYLIRVSKGSGKVKDGIKIKSVYKVNWDYKEIGVEKKVRKLHKYFNDTYNVVSSQTDNSYDISNLDGHLSKLVKPGDRVRRGRFSDDVKQVKGWYKTGYDAVREKIAIGPWGYMMSKLKEGNINGFTARDCLSFWEYHYQDKYNIPYIPVMGKDLSIFKGLFLVANKVQVLRMIRWVFESNQTLFKKPTVGLLGSGYRNKINDLATQWSNERKKKVVANV